MLRIKTLAFVGIALGLSACTSAPGPVADERRTSPIYYNHDSFPKAASLKICDGMRVSNAPKTDQYGRITSSLSVMKVSGVYLSRSPVSGCVSSGFGPRRGGASSFHHGVDLYTRKPAPVYAGGEGRIESMGTLRGYGKTILIRHQNDVKTRYAHLSSFAHGLSKGQRVRSGELIGYTGKTGNATAVHLHYEVIANGKRRNPLIAGR